MLTYISALIILIAVLIGQNIGVHSSLIMSPLFHVVMHLVGGIGIGLFLCALINSAVLRPMNRRRTVIVGVLIAGLIWEIVEAYYHINGFTLWTTAYYLDTTKDLICDVIGGIFVAWFYYRHEK